MFSSQVGKFIKIKIESPTPVTSSKVDHWRQICFHEIAFEFFSQLSLIIKNSKPRWCCSLSFAVLFQSWKWIKIRRAHYSWVLLAAVNDIENLTFTGLHCLVFQKLLTCRTSTWLLAYGFVGTKYFLIFVEG